MSKNESSDKHRKQAARLNLQPDDFYVNEQGFIVFTAAYHLRRGYCCRSGCKHCPYGYKKD